MNQEKHPFVFHNTKESSITQYLGSDGLPIEKTYRLYQVKCEDFKARAKKYAKENLWNKNSILHNWKCGYESSEQLEEEILLQREEMIRLYRKAFDLTFFFEDPNSIYECFNGESRKIRLIRELNQERSEKFSEDFDKKRTTWFTRYCILSRFIEAARKIILANRLKKLLETLKTLPPEMTRGTSLKKAE